jgi:hypothetical protein
MGTLARLPPGGDEEEDEEEEEEDRPCWRKRT